MKGMNNPPNEGGLEGETTATPSTERKKKLAPRRLPGLDLGKSKVLDPLSLKVILGNGAKKDLLEGRACPTSMSPKRASSMDVDTPTPSKRRKRVIVPDPKQKLITDVWRREGNDQ